MKLLDFLKPDSYRRALNHTPGMQFKLDTYTSIKEQFNFIHNLTKPFTRPKEQITQGYKDDSFGNALLELILVKILIMPFYYIKSFLTSCARAIVGLLTLPFLIANGHAKDAIHYLGFNTAEQFAYGFIAAICLPINILSSILVALPSRAIITAIDNHNRNSNSFQPDELNPSTIEAPQQVTISTTEIPTKLDAKDAFDFVETASTTLDSHEAFEKEPTNDLYPAVEGKSPQGLTL